MKKQSQHKKLLEAVNKLIGVNYIQEQSTAGQDPCQAWLQTMSPSVMGYWDPAGGPIQPGSNTVPHGDIDCCEMYKGNHGPLFIGNGNSNDTVMNRLCTREFNLISGTQHSEDVQEWAKCCEGGRTTPTGDDPCEEFNSATQQWQDNCCKDPNCQFYKDCCPGGTTTGTGTGTTGNIDPIDREPIDIEPSDRTSKKSLRESIKKSFLKRKTKPTNVIEEAAKNMLNKVKSEEIDILMEKATKTIISEQGCDHSCSNSMRARGIVNSGELSDNTLIAPNLNSSFLNMANNNTNCNSLHNRKMALLTKLNSLIGPSGQGICCGENPMWQVGILRKMMYIDNIISGQDPNHTCT